MTLISDIIAACERIKLRGEQPNTILMHPSLVMIRDVKGNARQRKRARFWNRKRIEHFKSLGLEVRIVTGPS